MILSRLLKIRIYTILTRWLCLKWVILGISSGNYLRYIHQLLLLLLRRRPLMERLVLLNRSRCIILRDKFVHGKGSLTLLRLRYQNAMLRVGLRRGPHRLNGSTYHFCQVLETAPSSLLWLVPVIGVYVLTALDSGGSGNLWRFLMLNLLRSSVLVSEEALEKTLFLNNHFPAILR